MTRSRHRQATGASKVRASRGARAQDGEDNQGGEVAPAEHVPVLYQETIEGLDPRSGGRYVDCTAGSGGHSAGILQASASRWDATCTGYRLRGRRAHTGSSTALWRACAGRTELISATWRRSSGRRVGSKLMGYYSTSASAACSSAWLNGVSVSSWTALSTCAWIHRVVLRQRILSIRWTNRRWRLSFGTTVRSHLLGGSRRPSCGNAESAESRRRHALPSW